ncbi:MAG: hypothetical protein HKN20_18490 [Gemmatimonadetes bacterium]|nr:hypothetical protein [Gemmatimonadota bacterium]
MSLYAAENRDRTSREEILLSRLFGTLFMVDRSAYLGDLLRRLDVSIPKADLEQLQIQFWPELGVYSPDLIIEGDSHLLFVVSRTRAALGAEKLKALAENGYKLSPRFSLLVITDGRTEPEELADLREVVPGRRDDPYRWIGWSDIYTTLHRQLDTEDETDPARGLINGFLGLLANKGLAPFVGFDEDDLHDYREQLPVMERVFATANVLARDLDHELAEHGIQRISAHAPTSDDLDPRFMHASTFHYVDESWDPGILNCGSLIVRIDFVGGEVHVGFRSNLTDSRSRALIVEARNRISEFFQKDESLLLRLSRGSREAEPTRDAMQVAPIETQEGSAITRAELVSIQQSSHEDLVETLVTKLVAMREFVADVPLIPIHRETGKSTFVIAGS